MSSTDDTVLLRNSAPTEDLSRMARLLARSPARKQKKGALASPLRVGLEIDESIRNGTSAQTPGFAAR